MSLFLDSELSLEVTFEVQEHLESCPNCRNRFEKERRLEENMRGILLGDDPEDAAACQRAVRQAVRAGRAGFPTRRVLARLTGVSVLVTLVAVPLLSADHRELDLARSAASDHSRFLAEMREEPPPSATLMGFRETGKEMFPAGRNLPRTLPVGYELLRAGRCRLDDASVLYLVMKQGGEPISMFLMPRSELHRFPRFEKRLRGDPTGVECRISGRRFFGACNREVVACAVGRTDPSELRDLVRWLVSG